MHFRWPFTFRAKPLRPAIHFKAVPGVDVRLAREFVCAPGCRFTPFKGVLQVPRVRMEALGAMQKAYQSDANRKPTLDHPLRTDIDIKYIDLGTKDAIGIPQDGNRAAPTGGEQ